MKGSGNKVAKARPGSMVNKIRAVSVIMITSVMKSTRCKDKNKQSRSVAAPIRAIKSPVRRPPKYSRDSRIKCS